MRNQELILLTHVPTESVNDGFLPAARHLGLSPVLLTDQAEAHRRHFSQSGLPAYPDAIIACDVFNPLAVIETVGRHGQKPAAIFSSSDHLQTSTAIVAEYFSLPGKNWKVTDRAKNKAEMRGYLSGQGIETMRYAAASESESLARAAADVGFPCVVKPREGVASQEVGLARDNAELAAHCQAVWQTRPGQVMLLEEYLVGPLCTLETLGDGKGLQALGGFHVRLSAPPQPADPPNALAAYLGSEQSLVYGHPFHPAPKSRQGFSAEDLQRYAPELSARFPLYYFAVRREHWLQQSLLPESADALLAVQAPTGLEADDNFALLPTHPWQARYLLSRPAVQAALEQDRLRDLGPQGPAYFATSSIRTLFHPDNPYFYKCSLHVRITNCVRKNAIYELDGALQVTRVMRTVGPRLAARFPGLRILEEPAYASVRLGGDESPAEREAAEGFGLILREGLDPADTAATTPLLAGSLFGNHTRGQARLREIIGRLARRQASPWDTVAENWFSAYVEQLLPPVLHCFF